ncbi:MAG: glutathione S-transferase family protein [Myxococcota bacterium]
MAHVPHPASPLVDTLEGLHLFHFDGAPCAQRVRFALREKGLHRGREVRFDDGSPSAIRGEPGRWVSRRVSLVRKDHMTPAYAAIHPDLVVPALVHEGQLHLESMDIIGYLDEAFGGAPLVPPGETEIAQEASRLTRLGKELHRSIRFVTFRWGLGSLGRLNAKEEQNLKQLLREQHDGENLIDFYEGYDRQSAKGGFPEAVYAEHLENLNNAFRDLDTQLGDGRPFLAGADLTMADVLWAMKAMRLTECGYPFEACFPEVFAWFERIETRPAFQEGVMGKHRLLHRAFRAKARLEKLFGVGLEQEVLRRVA